MRKKTRSHQAKTPLLRPSVIFVCVMAACAATLAGQSLNALPARAAPEPTLCSSASGITIPLPDSWESVPVSQPGLLCAFRSKNGGFPTLNVVEEPNKQPEIRPGVMARESSIRNAYHLVGLTDAQFQDSHIEPLGNQESFQTTVRYMNQGMSVEGFTMQVQLPDRVYTVTIVDREGHPTVPKEALLDLLRGIRVPGDAPFAAPQGRGLSQTTTLILIVIIAASMVLFGSRSAKASKKR